MQQLPLDVPLTGFVDHFERQYYQMYLPGSRDFVTVSVTSSQGDLDLYIKGNATSQFPQEDANFRSFASGDDEITLAWSDPRVQAVCGARSPNSQCPFSVLVYGFSASTFTIVAAAQGEAELLRDGSSVPGSLPAGNTSYYVFRVPSAPRTKSITLTLVDLSGDPDLFASFDTEKPNSNNAQYRSRGFGREVIVIHPSDSKYSNCTEPCRLWIAVLAYGTRSSSYRITASTGLELLGDGEPTNGAVSPLGFQYFVAYSPPRYFGSHRKDLVFTATATSGTVQIFINNRLTPSSPQGGTMPDYPQLITAPDGTYRVNNSIWSSEQTFGGERVVIASADS